MGIGVSFFTEGVGAGPRKHMDILGLSMNDGADLRVHPSGKAVVSISAQTQGQGHETTFAQIVAEELGIPPEDVEVRHGDTDKSPYGLGTYGSRSTPVSGGAVAIVSRKVRDKARQIAATMLEARPEDLAWEKGRWYMKGDPEKGAMIEDIAAHAYSGEPMPEGMEGGLDAQVIYDPPNLTYPYGAYIAVVDIDPDTAQVTVRRFIAVDDCGVRINPMIVDGQIHGGLAEGVGIALMELISFDEEGNCLNSSFMDYLIPTALECPDFELGETVTPCPHHPLGAKGIGESPNVGSPPAIVNAVIDALHETHGVDHIDMPCTPARVWAAMQGRPSRRSDGPRPSPAARRSSPRPASRSPARPSCARSARPARRRATPRSCWPTGRSRASSAATARSTACASTAEGDRDRRADAAADPALHRRHARGGDRGERLGHGAEPVPVGRRDRGVPRAGAARAARCSSRATRRSRGRCATLGAQMDLSVAAIAGEDFELRARRPRGRGRRARARRARRAAPRPRGGRALRRPGGEPPPRRRRRRPSCAATASPDELLERIDTPAGLDLGARTPAEIAVSILARIVEVRRRETRWPRGRSPSPRSTPCAA